MNTRLMALLALLALAVTGAGAGAIRALSPARPAWATAPAGDSSHAEELVS